MVGVLLANLYSAIKNMDSQYIILGPILDGEIETCWNAYFGWITKRTEATLHSFSVLTMPLPLGTTDLLEVSPQGDIRGLLMPLPSGRGGVNIFEKVS